MSEIVVFGAGGRAGRQAVAEALRRGHGVTAVVRDPAKYAESAHEGARLVAGDVTDPAGVAAAVAGRDAVIHAAAVYGAGTDPGAFFPGAARALLAGIRADGGTARLVVVGLSSFLTDASGVRLMDAPGFPREFAPFCRAHEAGLTVLAEEGGDVDWVYASPAGDFDHGGGRTGRYRVVGHGDADARVSYADFAVALLDEAADAPRHRGTHLAVTG
ncbi:NAD(P)-dependent oxidoreductase [Streptomyces specialis]|uniref:NAD(P)-dependent oxidoreductase n=1 Tax=Streptomyces specialis TaxID=498367 RepID=UPI00073F63FC|nr:NAD(P)H-binding protein [Streptomyces specialis]